MGSDHPAHLRWHGSWAWYRHAFRSQPPGGPQMGQAGPGGGAAPRRPGRPGTPPARQAPPDTSAAAGL